MQMSPLYWLYFGVGLIILEVMTPGLVSLFFGLSALTLALITWLVQLPQGAQLSQSAQWLGFSFFSVLYILLLRKSLKKVFNGDKEVSENLNDEYTGKLAVVLEKVAPNKPGRVEFCGSTWMAESEAELPAGASVRILGKKNLTLKIEAV
jgi:membrane protein implicated in regulation of membrane protease activity